MKAPARRNGPRRLLACLLAAITALALGGCSPRRAQNPSSPLGPVNAVADDGASSLMPRGADVVACCTDGHAAQGPGQFESRAPTRA